MRLIHGMAPPELFQQLQALEMAALKTTAKEDKECNGSWTNVSNTPSPMTTEDPLGGPRAPVTPSSLVTDKQLAAGLITLAVGCPAPPGLEPPRLPIPPHPTSRPPPPLEPPTQLLGSPVLPPLSIRTSHACVPTAV